MSNTYIHTPEAENALRDLCKFLFAKMLVRDSGDDATWTRRLKTFEVNGLLCFTMPAPLTAKEFVVDNSRLDDPRYRRLVARKMKAARPSKHTYVRLPIDRARFADEKYASDIATLLSYKWVNKMLPVDSALDLILLLKLDIHGLTRALDTMGMHESTGTNVARMLVRTTVEDLVDNHDGMKALLASMKAEIGEMRCAFERNVREIADEALANARVAIAPIVENATASCDEWLARHREESAARLAHVDAILEAERSRDPDAEWAAAMAESERKRKEANRLSPRARWLVGGAIAAVTVGLAFFLEIGNPGVTPVEFLTGLFGR